MKTIIYPNNCNFSDIFKFCDEVERLSGVEKINIDFSSMGRIEPFTMVYVAKFIRNFVRLNSDTTVYASGFENKNYAANMAFFRAFGLKHGREPNCTDGNDHFVPFTILRVRRIIDEALQAQKAEQDIIESRSEHLAKILSRSESDNLVDALTFSIREIMRNVFEHSKSKGIEYCAQYWSSYKKVEIAISDTGIGLKESLKNNPFIQVNNDSDAIQQALMPGISSKNYKGAIINKNDPWHNSGFGLYMTNRICRLGGSFLICSGNHGILLNENGKEHINLNHACKGTAIRMVLNTCKIGSLNKMLENFRKEGYEIAKQIKGIGVYDASAASQMLSRDFK
ncbi:MAG: ATP-binding protein [Pseudomonadota bacterium]